MSILNTYELLKMGFTTIGYMREMARHGGAMTFRDDQFVQEITNLADGFGLAQTYRLEFQAKGRDMVRRVLKIEEEASL